VTPSVDEKARPSIDSIQYSERYIAVKNAVVRTAKMMSAALPVLSLEARDGDPGIPLMPPEDVLGGGRVAEAVGKVSERDPDASGPQ